MHHQTGRSYARARRTTPKFEGLEGRELLSGGIAPPMPTPPGPISYPPPIVQPPAPAVVAPGQ
jgi:hypothetical protein